MPQNTRHNFQVHYGQQQQQQQQLSKVNEMNIYGQTRHLNDAQTDRWTDQEEGRQGERESEIEIEGCWQDAGNI